MTLAVPAKIKDIHKKRENLCTCIGVFGYENKDSFHGGFKNNFLGGFKKYI